MVKRIEVETLQSLADIAATGVRSELGLVAECVYLGQVTGSESNRSYIREPQEWTVEGSARRSQQTIAFEWRWGESVAMVRQVCKNAQTRAVRRPADLSTKVRSEPKCAF